MEQHHAQTVPGILRFIFLRLRQPPSSTLFPYTTLFRSVRDVLGQDERFRLQGIRRGQAEEGARSEEHTSELQSHVNLVCRLLLEKKNLRGRESILAIPNHAVTALQHQHRRA